jgi:hypothetical protein
VVPPRFVPDPELLALGVASGVVVGQERFMAA